MASPGGTSSGSSLLLQNSGSEEDLQQLMDQRKRKRMLSNRESARRSRMKKQKHLDDLTAKVALLQKENHRIITGISGTTQQYLRIEGENTVLRAQVAELSHRLHSLNEIINFLNANSGYFGAEEPYHSAAAPAAATDSIDGLTNCPWSYVYLNQPIMASADMLQY